MNPYSYLDSLVEQYYYSGVRDLFLVQYYLIYNSNRDPKLDPEVMLSYIKKRWELEKNKERLE